MDRALDVGVRLAHARDRARHLAHHVRHVLEKAKDGGEQTGLLRGARDVDARRELLRLALLNIGRTVPLQVATLGMIVVIGLAQNLWLATAVVGAAGGWVCVWRWMLVNRYEETEGLADAEVMHHRGASTRSFTRMLVIWHKSASKNSSLASVSSPTVK